MEEITIKIKKFRKENKITQVEMAKRLGITQGAYSQLENGDTGSMRVTTLYKLCKEFDLSADQLLGLDKPTTARKGRDLAYLRKAFQGRVIAATAVSPDKAKQFTEGKKHKYEIKR